ncbi:MAG: N-acetylmuramic acid 6-phosphate etherase [Oscillospiraceae bacterium]|nr:N-acetylmuramic acid 6-phosphate etherase [Oscillospiraceae bacterium]
MLDYTKLTTEQVNPATTDIDLCSSEEIVRLINEEDKKIAEAVSLVLPEIGKAVDAIVAGMRKGGHLYYVGAGTSGRLGVLDASECPPTYGTDPSLVVGIIAGGDFALRNAVEGAEDDPVAGAYEISSRNINENDVVVGITASGSARYVYGALEEGRKRGAVTVAVCTTAHAALSETADISILPVVGPEPIMGSTRMKSGTAQKMVLNMLTTATMVRLGKTFHNLMVDLTPTNIKLVDRTARIVMQATGADRATADAALAAAGAKPKVAIVTLLTGCDSETAVKALDEADGLVRGAIAKLGGGN